MVQVTETTARTGFKFKDVPVQVPMPYSEGHALTANEATFVNRQVASVIGNIFAGDINRAIAKVDEARAKALKEGTLDTALLNDDGTAKAATFADVVNADGTPFDWQAHFDTKYGAYEPGVITRGEGQARVSPLDRIANDIASGKVKELLDKNSIPFAKVRGEKFNAMVKDYRAKFGWVDQLAQAQLDAIGQHSEAPDADGLDELLALAGDTTAPAPDANGDDTTAPDQSENVDVDAEGSENPPA